MLMQKKPTILVTEEVDYVGSRAAFLLKTAGYNALILDNVAYDHRNIVESVLKANAMAGDSCDRTLLSRLFTSWRIEAIVHFIHLALGSCFRTETSAQ